MCKTVEHPAVNFDSIKLTPSQNVVGSTFEIEANFTVVNATGVGQFTYVLYIEASASRYEYYQTFEGYNPEFTLIAGDSSDNNENPIYYL
eukprot:gene15197-17983_t